MNPLIKTALKSRYDRIMQGKKPEIESKQSWCQGKLCARFKAMGGSCSKDACRFA